MKKYLKQIYNFFLITHPMLISGKRGLSFAKGKNFRGAGTCIKNRGGNTILIGNNVRMENCTIKLFGNSNQIIIADGCWFKDVDFHIEDNCNSIRIGQNTRFVGLAHIACTEGKSITIGNECLFSNEIVFRTGDSHSILNNQSVRINHAKDIVIEEHVWVGNKVIILKGCHVCSNSVVGSGSVLTAKKYPESSVIAGNPARVIQSNVNWEFEKI